MDVKPILTGPKGLNKYEATKQGEANSPNTEVQESKSQTITKRITDKLDMSEEAKKMLSIEQKVKSGSYNNLEILQKVAHNIFQKHFKS